MSRAVTQIEHLKKEKFVSAYSQDEIRGNVSLACDIAEIARGTYYNWLEKDKNFRTKIKEAKLRMMDDMEQVLIARAVDKSDTALIYWLKYNHPRYKEQPTNLTQINGEKIEVTMIPMPTEDVI